MVFVVGDIMLASTSEPFNNYAIKKFAEAFKIKDMGIPNYIIGMHIYYDRANGIIKLNQERYIKAMATKYGYADAKPVCTPHNATKLDVSMCDTSYCRHN